jgi:hypothetical protein
MVLACKKLSDRHSNMRRHSTTQIIVDKVNNIELVDLVKLLAI